MERQRSSLLQLLVLILTLQCAVAEASERGMLMFVDHAEPGRACGRSGSLVDRASHCAIVFDANSARRLPSGNDGAMRLFVLVQQEENGRQIWMRGDVLAKIEGFQSGFERVPEELLKLDDLGPFFAQQRERPEYPRARPHRVHVLPENDGSVPLGPVGDPLAPRGSLAMLQPPLWVVPPRR